ELPGGGERERPGADPELPRQPLPTRRQAESPGVDRAANDRHPPRLDARSAERRGDRFRDGDDAGESGIAQARRDTRLLVIDAPGDDGRDSREARGQPAQEIGATTAVAVKEVRALAPEQLSQPPRERQGGVAAAREVHHPDLRGSRGLAPPARRRTAERALAPASRPPAPRP